MIFKQGCLNFVTLYNEEFSGMARNACRTISNKKIFVNAIKLELPSRGFRSKSWYYFTRKKIELLKKLLEIAPENEFVGVFDCDIQFFDNNKLIELWENLKHEKFEYAGLTEGCPDKIFGENLFYSRESLYSEANTGFILLKNNYNSKFFLKHVLSKNFKEKSLSDQTAINESFCEFKIKVGLLNPTFFMSGCCRNPAPCVLHHANCTSNYIEKINQMNNFRKKIGAEAVSWSDSSFGLSTEIFEHKLPKLF